MFEYRAETKVASDRTLHLDGLPFEEGVTVEVVVSVAPKPKQSWPKGYIESTFGGIDDESFVRHPQGDFEVRNEMP